MMGNETNEIIEKLFDSFLQKYQEGLEESIRAGEFIRDIVLTYCITTFEK